jgi:hypothetical protein
MSNGLALMTRREFRSLQDFNGGDFTWLLIGALLGVLSMCVISRLRRRWF